MTDSNKCTNCGRFLSSTRIGKRTCATCERNRSREARDRRHDLYVQRTYGLSPGAYRVLYDLQGGRCYICQRATGKTKKLAVDHDHTCCKTLPACGKCVRGLCCSKCNQMLGHARDDIEFFKRAIAYLKKPPYWGYDVKRAA